MSRRGRSEAGVTIVEAALVIPLLFMFIFGLVDLGMWTLNSNQAANAARDGARKGILEFPLRGTTTEQDARDAIVAAIQERLPEGTVDSTQITITCQDGTGTTIACTSASPERVKVDVAWKWTLVTPVATVLSLSEGSVSGTATMEIVGRPLAVAPPPSTTQPPDPLVPTTSVPCSAGDLTTPTTVYAKSNQLSEPMPVTFTHFGGECNDLRIVLQGTKSNSTDELVTHFCGCGVSPNHSWTYAGSNNIWHANGNKGVATLYEGTTVLDSTDFWVAKG